MRRRLPPAYQHFLCVLSLVAASVLALSEPLRFIHFALGHHVVCPEHGELVHVEEGTAAGYSANADAAAIRWAEDGSHEHDHCGLGCQAQNPAVADRGSSVDEPAPARSAEVQTLRSITPAQPVFSYAPKQSPPALLS